MKKLQDAEIFDGDAAYILSCLKSAGFNVFNGIVLNEYDILKILSGITNELFKYLSEFHGERDFVVMMSVYSENRDYNLFEGLSGTKLFVNYNSDEITNAIKYFINIANKKHAESADNKNRFSLNLIIQNVTFFTTLTGFAFSNAIDRNGSEIIRIEAHEGVGEIIEHGSSSLSMINVNKKDLFKKDPNIKVYGKAFDYSRIIDIALEVNKIEKYLKEPVAVEWYITNKGEIIFSKVDIMKEPYICTWCSLNLTDKTWKSKYGN